MLFVFQVDTGIMRTFPMNLAMESVQNLKHHIFNQSGISVENQVLLISGGEPIEPHNRVCSYSTGTDTNPIFLFSKDTIKAESPPKVEEEVVSSNIDFAEKVQKYKALNATLETVKKRASLAQLFYDVDLRILKQCEDLVHDQHLQQLGWSTVVANLDDLSAALSKRWELYQAEYSEYLANRDSYIEFLAHFKDDLQVLKRIPVLPALIELQKLVPDGDDDVFEDLKDNVTLYDWIAKADGVYDELCEACKSGLSQLDEDGYNRLSSQIKTSLRLMKDEQLTEVKGLSSRLEQLETLKNDATRLAKEQKDITESLMKNQSRADSAKDPSILPDLCKSQPYHLDMLLQNHEQMVDMARRCIVSKDEVCQVLCKRLAHIMRVECAFVEIDTKLVFGFNNLHVLRNNLRALQQVRDAPTAYFKAVVEVVRRLSFSKSYLTWAKNVSSGMQTIYNEECSKRLEFQAQYGGHFLDRLFPGMKDLPPEFATQEPPAFDAFLPNLSEDDVIRLRDMLPEYSELLETPDMTAIENFFRLRSSAQLTKDECGKTPHEEGSTTTEETLRAIAESENDMSGEPASKISRANDSSITPHALPHLKDLDRGCESETDTEEFEKVGHQSPYDLNFDRPSTSSSSLGHFTAAPPAPSPQQLHSSPRPPVVTQDVATLTEVGCYSNNENNNSNNKSSPLPPKKPPRTFQKSTTITSTQSQDSSGNEITIFCAPTIPSSTTTATTATTATNILLLSSAASASLMMQRTLSISAGSQSNTESFTNLKNPSLESIDELSGLRNFGSNTDSCFNSHHHQQQQQQQQQMLRSKSISPNTPQSPKDLHYDNYYHCCCAGANGRQLPLSSSNHQMQGDFVVMPSSSSSPTANSPVNSNLNNNNGNNNTAGHQPNDFVTDEFYIDESLPSSLSIETAATGQHSQNGESSYVKQQLDTANNVVALLQDNLGMTKSEYERVKSILIRVVDLSGRLFDQLRKELAEIKSQVYSVRDAFDQCSKEMVESCTQFILQREQEIVQRLTVDHELEISDFRKINHTKNEQIKELLSDRSASEEEFKKLVQTVLDLEEKSRETITKWNEMKQAFEDKLKSAEVEKEQAMKDISDRLKAEHRSDIENIRARFKLMTMERSPSESSLEKIDRSELSSLGHTEALLLQLTENFESEKEVAVSDAVAKEALKWQNTLDEIKRDMEERAKIEKQQLIQDISRRVNQDKDRQIDELRDQIHSLNFLVLKYKNTLHQVTEKPEESLNIELSQRIVNLENEKSDLEAELRKYQGERTGDMSASVSVYEGKVDASTSPLRMKRRSESTSSAPGASSSTVPRLGKLNVESCRAHDFVLVMWDAPTRNYRILQDSIYIYFLHSECYEELGLDIVDGQPNKQHCFAEVVSKEFCHARKSVNRFNVPKGTKFFRVRVKVPGVLKEETASGSAAAVTSESSTRGSVAPQEQELQRYAAVPQSQATSIVSTGTTTSTFFSAIDDTSCQRASSSPSLSPFSNKNSKLTSSQQDEQQCLANESSQLISWDDPEPPSGSFYIGSDDVPPAQVPQTTSATSASTLASSEEEKCEEGDSITFTEQQQSIETSTLTLRSTEQDQEVPSGGDVQAVVDTPASTFTTTTTKVVVPENVEKATEIQEDFEVYESER